VLREVPPMYLSHVCSRHGVGTTRSDDHGHDDALSSTPTHNAAGCDMALSSRALAA